MMPCLGLVATALAMAEDQLWNDIDRKELLK
jgi:hypothetical protein